MFRRTVSGVMLVLLLIGMFSLTVSVKPVEGEWTGTVYILADGSIDPPDAPIITYDNTTYFLTNNITGDWNGIVVERDNIIIDGVGYTIQGSGKESPGRGIILYGRINVTVKNIQIKNFQFGVWVAESSCIIISGNIITNNKIGVVFWGYNNTISRNNITDNEEGVNLFSNNTHVSGNNITNNYHGVYFGYSSNNTVSGNNIKNNLLGIRLYASSNNIISGNGITDNIVGLDLIYSSDNNTISGNIFVRDGLMVGDSFGNVVFDNFVNGKPLVYLEGVSNQTVSEAGQVILINCNNITVKNLNLSSTIIGVHLWRTNNTTITQNNIANNRFFGVHLSNSYNNSVSGNNLAKNRHSGVRVYNSSNNNIISGNNITANNYYGVQLHSSFNNSVIGNDVTNNWYGVYLYFSSNNSVSGNNIAKNGHGLEFYYSSNNQFYHNNLIDNSVQVYSEGSVNVWDDGYPSGGNYWGDYSGVDLYSGPYQNVTGSDGIGDTPYIIDENNVDGYPLMRPWKPITIKGDINHDGTINIFDIVLVASIYGCREGEPKWNPEADLAPPYGKIDIFDLVTCAYHYGERWKPS